MEIRTKHIRQYHSKIIGKIHIEYTYIDRPADILTWIDHVTILAKEYSLPPLQVHEMLFKQLPEIFR